MGVVALPNVIFSTKLPLNNEGCCSTTPMRLRWDYIEDIARILDMDPMEMIQVDESLVFNHCHQSGKFGDIHNNFPKELKEQYENRIAHLETEVLFLRKQLER